MDAISLLKDDHRRVETLFQQFEGEADVVRRGDVAGQIISELTLHADAEEAWFYPRARHATAGAERLTDEALQEHRRVRQVIAQLESLRPEDDGYAPTMLRLKRLVQQHVQAEENELFPEVSTVVGQDELDAIGSRISEMKRASAPRG